MSLIATLYGNDAIVMASDSRLTTNLTPKETLGEDGVKTIEKTKGIFMSDTAHKTFLCPNGCGISYCGDSSFGNFTIEAILKNFIALHISKSVAVKDIPQLLQDFIQTNYTGLSTRFHVAGYSADDKMQNLFSVDTNPKNPQIIETDTKRPGIIIGGEVEFVTKLWNNVLWANFTIQDKIDYARYAIMLTADTQRFKCDLQTVGGPIDILVIEAYKSYWISRKREK